ncbi:MAG: Hsp20/alpha crystallin family protein [Propionibacteriaceae bacterium]|jgi:HSP20 family protein|nr:Hsp20/alpha crystallin family protein [Propionibacteriaceae bacterium]
MARAFDPFREMDRWFADPRTPTVAAMPMDLYRDGDNFVVTIDLPGVDPSSIDIDINERTLTVRAERVSQATETTKWLARERPNGTFARQLTIGSGVATDKIAANYADGVLTLTIPVAEEAKPRKIAVTHADKPASIDSEVVEQG